MRRRHTERSGRFVGYWKLLPPKRAALLLLVLWANAVVTVILQGSSIVAVEQVAARLWHHRSHGTRGWTGRLPNPSLPVLIPTLAAHQVVRWSGMRVLDRLIAQSDVLAKTEVTGITHQSSLDPPPSGTACSRPLGDSLAAWTSR